MLSILQNKYYIVRLGDFATNGNTKLIYGLFSIILSFDDYISRNSTDCFLILFGSTIIWTFVELFLHTTHTRIIKPMYIVLRNEKYQLSQTMGIILQGLQEGGVITTVGLYFGDRLYEIKYIILLHAFILCIVVNICMKKNILKASKRQVNTSSSLMLISTVTIYDIESLYNNPEHIQRQLSMFFVMIYICSFWTFFTWYKGFRTIEIHMKNPTYNAIINIKSNTTPPSPTTLEYYVKPVTNLDTFYILTYDVIFEIGVAYLLFYNMFLI
jgi:hypothetical protein